MGPLSEAELRASRARIVAASHARRRAIERTLHDGAQQHLVAMSVKLRLADKTFYTPDFAVMAGDGFMEMHEVKGFWTDDARVKIKVAADQYPFRFIAFKAIPKSRGGGWVLQEGPGQVAGRWPMGEGGQ